MNLETRNNLKNYHRDEQYILTVIALACNLVLIYFNSVLLDFTYHVTLHGSLRTQYYWTLPIT